MFSINCVRVVCSVMAVTARLSKYLSSHWNILGDIVALLMVVTTLADLPYVDFPTAIICCLRVRWAAQ